MEITPHLNDSGSGERAMAAPYTAGSTNEVHQSASRPPIVLAGYDCNRSVDPFLRVMTNRVPIHYTFA